MSTESTEEQSKKPESEMGLDLDLHFLPAWAQKGSGVNQYESFTGEEGPARERRGGRRDFPGGNRDRGPRRPDRPRPPEGARPPGGGPQRQGQFRGDRREGGRGRGGPRRDQGGRPQERPQIKLPE